MTGCLIRSFISVVLDRDDQKKGGEKEQWLPRPVYFELMNSESRKEEQIGPDQLSPFTNLSRSFVLMCLICIFGHFSKTESQVLICLSQQHGREVVIEVRTLSRNSINLPLSGGFGDLNFHLSLKNSCDLMAPVLRTLEEPILFLIALFMEQGTWEWWHRGLLDNMGTWRHPYTLFCLCLKSLPRVQDEILLCIIWIPPKCLWSVCWLGGMLTTFILQCSFLGHL